jgi:signal transduction histidine kinase
MNPALESTAKPRVSFERSTLSTRVPGALYRRVRIAQGLLPPLIILVVVSYQFIVVRLEPNRPAFWAEILFYGILGPLVTFFVLSWIAAEVRERERAETELRALYLELSESHERLAAVQRVTRDVSEASDLEGVLETAITSISEAVGATAGAIVLDGGVARAYNLEELPREVLDLEPLRDAVGILERPSAAQIAKNRLSAPIRFRDRFFGAVHLYFAGMPHSESRELLEILIGELAVAVDAASIRTRDLLTLFEVDRSIRAESNLERLLEGVLSRISERVNAEASAVYLADEDDRLTLAWGRNVAGQPLRAGLEHGWSVGNLARQSAMSRTPLSVPDLDMQPDLETEAGRVLLRQPEDPVLGGARAAIALPMLTESELVGVIVLGHQKPGAFEPRELPFLGLLASQITLAVRNARAYLYSEELAIFDERNRIAREIHDGIAQSLAFTAMKLDLAKRLLEREPERVRGELETAKTTLREQIKEVRRSIFALRPIDLERLGFLETVRQYVKDFGEQNDVKTTLELQGEPKLSLTNEAVMFRILQESLNNIAKHSRAKNASVTLETAAEGVRLTVQDDGVGFDPTALTGRVTTAGGLGLVQMRERVESRGGHFEYASSAGHGTRITAMIA